MDIKKIFRRFLLGYRFQEQLQNDHITIGRLGNQLYFSKNHDLLASNARLNLHSHEFSCYSQNGEDGLILFLLSRVGAEHHFMVEIGTEDGRECNSANLILNFGWRGLLIEANRDSVEEAIRYFRECGVTERVNIKNTSATPENINDLLRHGEASENLDILSIDIDSYDYWLWEAITAVAPKIVVIEYNATFGPNRSVSIPRDSLTVKGSDHPYYHGASITALKKLGESKGYDLVGCDSRGVNSFFVRKDLTAVTGLEILESHKAYRKHFRRSRKKTTEEQFREISHLPLVEID